MSGPQSLINPLPPDEPQFPKHVFLIVLNEFCERFSYYGIKAVLSLYLKDALNYNEDTFTILYHLFCTLCYCTPLLGGTLADSWLGKYKTILYLSIVYTLGNAILSLGAVTVLNLPNEELTIVGLVFVAIGMGGIKPCVSAFGGDQFKLPEQQAQLASFFSIFYFCINTGALLSMLISPILRKNVKCFDLDSCFPLSFGLPCVLMIISIALLVSGTPFYTFKDPEDNVLKKIIMCTYYALKGKITSTRQQEVANRSHWLEYADDKYNADFIEDLKQLHRVMALFIPASFFWALFDQHGSRWTFQATGMNGEIFDHVLRPDQMQLLNPLLMLPLIVIFHQVIYPISARFGLLKSNLQRMTVGGILIACSFLVAGLLQMELDKTYPDKLVSTESSVNVISNIPCSMNLKVLNTPLHSTLEPYSLSTFDKLEAGKIYQYWASYADATKTCRTLGHATHEKKAQSGKTETIFLLYDDSYGISFFESNYTERRLKSGEGIPFIRFAFFGIDKKTANDAVLIIKSDKNDLMNVWADGSQDSQELNKYEMLKMDNVPLAHLETPTFRTESYWHSLELHVRGSQPQKLGRVHPQQGGSYLYVISKSPDDKTYTIREHIITTPNSIHMLWLIPQYFLLTTAEVMFSISGYEFAFNEAPTGMKSFFQAMWLFTMAYGNIFVIVLTKFRVFEKQFQEFFMFSAMMFIATTIFAIMASKYKGRNVIAIKQDGDTKHPTEVEADFEVDEFGDVVVIDTSNDDDTLYDEDLMLSSPSIPINILQLHQFFLSSNTKFDSNMCLFIRAREEN